MRVVIVDPPHDSPARGNAVTVARWARNLRRLGTEVLRARPTELPAMDEPADLVHAHHAVHCGPAALRFARRRGIPLVVSLGGTDLNGPEGRLHPLARPPLEAADAIVGPFALDGERLVAEGVDADRFHVIRRGVELPPEFAPPPDPFPLEVVLVGGLRPIKGQLDALEWLRAARDADVDARLTLVGPIIDEEYAAEVIRRLGSHRLASTVPHDEMAQVYESANVVLNASRAEGASNAILEAWAHGRPVAARRAPGNEELLDGAPAGIACLFPGEEPQVLVDWLAERLEDRDDVGRTARKWVATRHAAADEARELRSVYAGLVG